MMKIVAIASAGGHWIQLLRLMPAFSETDITFVSTNKSFAQSVKGYDYYDVPDGNRWSKLKLIYMGLRVAYLIIKIRPTTIVTTGAAPGLMAVLVGKLIRAKTIWVDSIANVDRLSMSGRIASHFTDKCYTQWPHLATEEVVFSGNVLI